MDPQVQTSFIPKKSLIETSARNNGGFSIFFLLALLVFIASLASAGAALGYQSYLKKSIADKDASLKISEGAFEPDTIDKLVLMDRRITQTQALLQKHIAPSAVFGLIGDLTLASVQFEGLDFTLGTNGAATISMNGSADSFSSVALQSDQFGGSKLLKEVVFSGITVGLNGRVTFSIKAVVDPSVISYSKQIISPSGTTQTATGTQTTP